MDASFWLLICPFLDVETLLQFRGVEASANQAVNAYLAQYKGRPTHMLLQYRGENEGSNGIKYLTNEERELQKLTIKDGKFYLNSELFTSGFSGGSGPQAQQAHLFAIDLAGNFYVYRKLPKINHSTMLAGGPVICAGFMQVVKGKLYYISNCSGHYQPQVDALLLTIRALLEKNVHPSTYEIKYEAPKKLQPKSFKTAKVFIDGVPYSLKSVVKNLGLLLDK